MAMRAGSTWDMLADSGSAGGASNGRGGCEDGQLVVGRIW